MTQSTAEVQTAPEYAKEITKEVISITQSAGEKFVELLNQADDEITGVRVFVAGGGCSGMTYGMTFSTTEHDTDGIIAGEGYKVFVDPITVNFMAGAEIDYMDNGVNASFMFNNVFKSVGGSGLCSGCGGGG
ncbi:MAG: iron-sulfur cluster assembly accessory protein [Acidiferrobacteraceae bacterium]|jgi:iron-sulfur cluster insertion protein|nr:iron-sulfur cluster assembly accessory protein [Acidiferrobacteraceae bacterium]MDP6123141.1 iron-sulfur cluster assembly accessory protein [Arenicellales bacterium]MDP6435538.1 iron-sulfur cluster assembly accessory protein [Arenicellales bacterium]MDP6672237.1 iron-sulfur cluster assembly accessory protein [Arenicellales bacterium]MDP6723783.1 iron-sulfur cluster assembly accessory protein [Arenicellales bacterium]|tara:strand:- start:4 stop:399 length:396 start_codon:yes stop_codon:yes gene_type:complete